MTCGIVVASRLDLQRCRIAGVGGAVLAAGYADPFRLISFRDPFTPPVQFENCEARLDIIGHDASPGAGMALVERRHAKEIVGFFLQSAGKNLLIQCEAGIGRSAGAAAALLRFQADPIWHRILAEGRYNRQIYRLVCQELSLCIEPEPLVAIAVRVKYPLDRTTAFCCSMLRQRYDNWRCLFVTDGELDDANEPNWYDPRFELVETVQRNGLWGHPYRQLGIDRCLKTGAAYVGLSNDDNYYTPGYLEQMIGALQRNGADFALCQMAHSYSAWGVVAADPVAGCADVGNWLASAELIRQVPWEGTDFLADGRFVERLAAKARKIVKVERPLFVKN